MANGMVPYVKEEGVATFCDVNAWKSYGINKSFGEVDPSSPGNGGIAQMPSVKLPQSSKASVPYKLSPHQLGQAESEFGKDASGKDVKADVVNNI